MSTERTRLRAAFQQSELARAEAEAAREQARARREALLRIARLAGQVDAEQLLTDVLAEMVAVVGADAGGVYIWDEGQGGLVTVRNTLPTEIPLIRPGQGGAGRVWVEQQPLILNDYQAEANVLPTVAATGICSGVVVPLNHEGRRLGTIGISSFDPAKRFTEEDADTLQIFASTAAATLVGIERAQRLRESEQRFQQLAENARDVVFRYRLKPTRGFEWVSPSVTQLTGYTVDELYAEPPLGRSSHLVHPDDQAMLD
ncbi:MAG TPA: GAF domain-containing protein, partial [Dehalococcoidia bacterium]|nr:GAF domain-containing protein [Dehalococcoidia bacterium]